MLCWMSEQRLSPRGKYTIKHTTRSARAIVEQIEYKVDINTLEHDAARASSASTRSAASSCAARRR